MKIRFFAILCAIFVSTYDLFADVWGAQIGDLYYNLNSTDFTASVTYKSFTNYVYNDRYYEIFNKDWGITTANIPESVMYKGETYIVKYISDSAFRNCYSLTSVTIGDSVTSIGDLVFSGCNSLTSITIGDSVKSIGQYAFSNCSSLAAIKIPNRVKSISDYA